MRRGKRSTSRPPSGLQQAGRDDAQEHEAGGGAGARELLHPQAEREPQRGVAEQAERLPDQEQAGVAVREQALHSRYAKVRISTRSASLRRVLGAPAALAEALEHQLDDLSRRARRAPPA